MTGLRTRVLVDLSSAQTADQAHWALTQRAVAGVYVKASEGAGYEDPRYQLFRELAYRHGVPCGAYLFLRGELAAAQVDRFLAFAKPRYGDLEPVVDSESAFPIVASTTLAALERLAEHGYRPGLYSYSSFLESLYAETPTLQRFWVWQADYEPSRRRLDSSGFAVTVRLWQYTDRYRRRSLDASRILAPPLRIRTSVPG